MSILFIFRIRWLKEGATVGHLVLMTNNCTGKNKNKTKVEFLLWLVETGFCKQVSLIFLIKDYTKNICDHFYNLVKHTYHNVNIYTEAELDCVLGEHEQVDVQQVPKAAFKDFESWQTGYYMEQDNVTKYHEFSFLQSPNNETKFEYWTVCQGQYNSKSLMPTKGSKCLSKNFSAEEHKAKLLSMYEDLQVIKSEGLSDQKQFELYFKWRKLIPSENRDVMCPKPEPDVIAREKMKEEKLAAKEENEKQRQAKAMEKPVKMDIDLEWTKPQIKFKDIEMDV